MSRITYKLTQKMIDSYLSNTNEKDVELVKKACSIFGITFEELLSSKSTMKIANCRKALTLVFRSKDRSIYTLVNVGKLIRAKPCDYTDVIYMQKTAISHLERELAFKQKYDLLAIDYPIVNGLVAKKNFEINEA